MRRLLDIAAVLALAAWSGSEALWQWTASTRLEEQLPVAILWAVALPLPLLAARRCPSLAAIAVVALVIARDLAGYRAPGSAAQSVILLVALFAAEAGARPRSFPLGGLAAGGLLLGAAVAMDLTGHGSYTNASIAAYAHLTTLVIGGVGAGVVLRDRGADARELEREARDLEARAEERVGHAVASERVRIAAEIETAVAVLLRGVRPLAERASRASPEQLATEMAAVRDRAQAAMLELRAALRLLRTPAEPGVGPDLGEAVAASRRTRVRHVLGWIGPVALLALLGLAEQFADTAVIIYGGPVYVPEPLLGPASPWISAVVCVLPLLARRRAPVAATLAVFALVIARMLVYDLSALTFTQFYVPPAATFLGVAHTRRRWKGVLLTAAGAGTTMACMALEQIPYDLFAYSFAVLLPTAAGVAGLLVRDRVAMGVRARRARERADRAQELLARERILDERLRAARELHDVVGHAVTVMTLQAAVAVRYATLDIERARAAGASVLEIAADAERDLARLNALLDTEQAAPPPASLEQLVERVRAAGLPVTLEQQVPDDELPLPVALTAIRVVQEALTNVGRHAGTVPTTVTAAREDGVLVIEVVNAPGDRGVGGGGGRGLAGMHERVELYGGELSASPTATGGWRVRAALPVSA